MLSDRFDAALVWAHSLHRCQVRKGSETPYIAHLLTVASLVLEHGGTEDEAIAALLHDAIEDQGGETIGQEIDQRFGPEVGAIVRGCTDAFTAPKPPWEARKQAYVEHLHEASGSILLVSAADKVHNAGSIVEDYRRLGDAVYARFTASKAQTLWYYRAILTAYRGASAFRARPGIAPLVDLLEELVRKLERA